MSGIEHCPTCGVERLRGNLDLRESQARDALDREQTATEHDQTASDQDQTWSDHDQTASDRDQRSADEDQQASDNDLAAGGDRLEHERSSVARERSSNDRALVTQARDETGAARLETAADRDEAAEERDRQAAARDLAALLNNLSNSANGSRDEILLRAQQDRLRAATDRSKAAADRLLAGADRERAAQDRAEAVEQRAGSAGELERALTDELTGARTRDVGLVEVGREIERAERTGTRLALGFIDVDGLKGVNDSQGHAAGDAFLQAVGSTLRASVRSYDLIVRVGGDEFVCAMPNTTLAAARQRLEQIIPALSAARRPGSVSFGVAELEPGDDAQTLIARADAGLLAVRRTRPNPA